MRSHFKQTAAYQTAHCPNGLPESVSNLPMRPAFDVTHEYRLPMIIRQPVECHADGMSSLDNATGTITKSPYNGEDKIIKITFGIDWTTFDGKGGHQTMCTLMTDHGINKQ